MQNYTDTQEDVTFKILFCIFCYNGSGTIFPNITLQNRGQNLCTNTLQEYYPDPGNQVTLCPEYY